MCDPTPHYTHAPHPALHGLMQGLQSLNSRRARLPTRGGVGPSGSARAGPPGARGGRGAAGPGAGRFGARAWAAGARGGGAKMWLSITLITVSVTCE